MRQAETVPKQAEGAPENRFIRGISKRNLNVFSKGVQSEKKENSSQQKINPMDVTDLFERYMGFKH